MRSLPRLLLAACACFAVAVLLTAAGIGLDLLPEEVGAEWNGLPLSEYGLGDLAGGIVLFGLAAALLAGIHLRRGGGGAPPAGRRLATGLLIVGVAPLVAVAVIVALALALCSSGACS